MVIGDKMGKGLGHLERVWRNGLLERFGVMVFIHPSSVFVNVHQCFHALYTKSPFGIVNDPVFLCIIRRNAVFISTSTSVFVKWWRTNQYFQVLSWKAAGKQFSWHTSTIDIRRGALEFRNCKFQFGEHQKESRRDNLLIGKTKRWNYDFLHFRIGKERTDSLRRPERFSKHVSAYRSGQWSVR